MPGDEDASALVDGWIDAQRKMWESWSDATRAAKDDSGAEPWRDVVELALRAWAAEVVPIARAAGESIAQGSERTVELLEFSMRAWRAMLTGGGADDWDGVAGQFVGQLCQRLLQGPTQIGELWRLSLDELARLQASWLEEFMPPAPGDGAGGGNGDAEPTVLQSFNDRYWDSWERTFGRLLESPNVGHTREITQKSMKAMGAWVRFRRAAAEYQVVLGAALGQAWSEFLAGLASRMEQGQGPTTAREVLRLWGTTADRVLTEAFATEDYARAQGQLVNTAMAYRLTEREVVDLFLQMSHIPSRSELDEANRSIFELKRQVRDLQRAVKQLAERPSPPRAKTPPKGGKPS